MLRAMSCNRFVVAGPYRDVSVETAAPRPPGKGTPAYTVDDPTIFTRPFTVAVPMRRNDEPMFEYACHEGNYGLLNILRGARAQEAQEQ